MMDADDPLHDLDVDGLRADARIVIDHPGRKLWTYPNLSGEIVLVLQEGDERFCTGLYAEEVPALCRALMRAATEAKPIADAIDADYGAHVAIETAKGGAA